MDKIKALSDILASNPDDSFARYGLAMAHAAEDRPTEALEEYNETIRRAPDYVPAYQMSAQLLLQMGQHDQARDRLQQGLEAAHRTGNAHAASEMQAMVDDLPS